MEHNFLKSLLSVIKIVLKSKLRSRITYKKGNKVCFILANGPSLNSSLKSFHKQLESNDLFVVNHFAFTNHFNVYKPLNYVLAAPEFFKEDVECSILESNLRLFEIFEKEVDWDMNLFVPFMAKQNPTIERITRLNKRINFLFFNLTPIEGYQTFCNHMIRRGLGMPRPHNVLIPTLVLALNTGYSKMSIFGADHSWLPEVFVTKSNRVLLSQKHFYDENSAKAEPMNKGGKGERKLHEILQKWMYAFSGYFIIENYSKSLNAKIINKTPNSYIDAFIKEY